MISWAVLDVLVKENVEKYKVRPEILWGLVKVMSKFESEAFNELQECFLGARYGLCQIPEELLPSDISEESLNDPAVNLKWASEIYSQLFVKFSEIVDICEREKWAVGAYLVGYGAINKMGREARKVEKKGIWQQGSWQNWAYACSFLDFESEDLVYLKDCVRDVCFYRIPPSFKSEGEVGDDFVLEGLISQIRDSLTQMNEMFGFVGELIKVKNLESEKRRKRNGLS